MPETMDQVSRRLDGHIHDSQEHIKLLIKVSSDMDNLVMEMRQAREDNLRRFDAIEEDIDRVNKVLSGNGSSGLLTDVAALKQNVEHSKEDNTETKDLFWKIAAFAFALASIVVNFLPRVSV